MPGSGAANLHRGSRSEILADYFFSQWGTVTPVRWPDDYGVDLYCTISKRIGRRAVVCDYFVVQVKSNTKPWVFENRKSVEWLVEHPVPLFLACVGKNQGILSIYHVMPRFYVWALGESPDHIELLPGKGGKRRVPAVGEWRADFPFRSNYQRNPSRPYRHEEVTKTRRGF
jgi:hypothetical protein